MAKKHTPRPTDAELRILAVLWARGPSTVREVHQAFGGEHEVGSTTVLKLMQIMTDKGLISRDRRRRPQVYTARRTEEETHSSGKASSPSAASASEPG